MTVDDIVQGGCLCTEVRYRFTGAPRASSICHCRTCRLAAGAQSVAWLVVPARTFAFTAGEPRRFRSSPEVVRTFCRTCGTSITYQHDHEQDVVELTTATLDHPERFPPIREVWLDHRLPWVVANDRLVHFQGDSS